MTLKDNIAAYRKFYEENGYLPHKAAKALIEICEALYKVKEAAEDIMENCPYQLVEASIPKSQNLELPQVVGTWHVAYLRKQVLEKALSAFREKGVSGD